MNSADPTKFKESCFAYKIDMLFHGEKPRFLTESEKVTVVWQIDKDAGASWSYEELNSIAF